jgi:7-cyano-7-deazaguanine reductase
MTTKKVTKKRVAKNSITTHLGQTSKYESQYNPKLLIREKRSHNRKYLKIKDSELPFIGYDVWNGYEISALLENGLPITAIAKVVYSSDSKYIVESKSMKLYWNSFNMTKLGYSRQEVFDLLTTAASQDLSKLLETDVKVTLYDVKEKSDIKQINFGKDIINLDNCVDDKDNIDAVIEFPFGQVYVETPSLLEIDDVDQSTGVETKVYHSSLLKSNCKVTAQPDWGDIYIRMTSDKHPLPLNLLKYIVSFRDECHFHEEICECIYKRLWDLCSPKELSVTCLYTRRGGWDINPHRCSHEHLMNVDLYDVNTMHIKTSRQ